MPGVNSPVGIYCFDSKASSRRTFVAIVHVQCEKALILPKFNHNILTAQYSFIKKAKEAIKRLLNSSLLSLIQLYCFLSVFLCDVSV